MPTLSRTTQQRVVDCPRPGAPTSRNDPAGPGRFPDRETRSVIYATAIAMALLYLLLFGLR